MAEPDLISASGGASATAVRPTKKQQELLGFIARFIDEHGYSPSYREIMNGCQYTSVATVALHVGNLIKRGHLRKRDHSARSIEVVRTGLDNGLDDKLGNPADKPAAKAEADEARHGEWLVAKLSMLVKAAEDAPGADAALKLALHDIQTLLAACDVLALDGLTKPLLPRVQALLAKYA